MTSLIERARARRDAATTEPAPPAPVATPSSSIVERARARKAQVAAPAPAEDRGMFGFLAPDVPLSDIQSVGVPAGGAESDNATVGVLADAGPPLTGAVVGAAVGGPPGMFLGAALGGAFAEAGKFIFADLAGTEKGKADTQERVQSMVNRAGIEALFSGFGKLGTAGFKAISPTEALKRTVRSEAGKEVAAKISVGAAEAAVKSRGALTEAAAATGITPRASALTGSRTAEAFEGLVQRHLGGTVEFAAADAERMRLGVKALDATITAFTRGKKGVGLSVAQAGDAVKKQIRRATSKVAKRMFGEARQLAVGERFPMDNTLRALDQEAGEIAGVSKEIFSPSIGKLNSVRNGIIEAAGDAGGVPLEVLEKELSLWSSIAGGARKAPEGVDLLTARRIFGGLKRDLEAAAGSQSAAAKQLGAARESYRSMKVAEKEFDSLLLERVGKAAGVDRAEKLPAWVLSAEPEEVAKLSSALQNTDMSRSLAGSVLEKLVEKSTTAQGLNMKQLANSLNKSMKVIRPLMKNRPQQIRRLENLVAVMAESPVPKKGDGATFFMRDAAMAANAIGGGPWERVNRIWGSLSSPKKMSMILNGRGTEELVGLVKPPKGVDIPAHVLHLTASAVQSARDEADRLGLLEEGEEEQ